MFFCTGFGVLGLVGPFGVGLCASIYARNVAAMAATPVVVTTKIDERNGIADAVELEQKFEVPEEVPGEELGRPLPTSTCAAQGAIRHAVTPSSFFATGMPVANAHVACAQSPRVHTRVRIKWTYQDKSYSFGYPLATHA